MPVGPPGESSEAAGGSGEQALTFVTHSGGLCISLRGPLREKRKARNECVRKRDPACAGDKEVLLRLSAHRGQASRACAGAPRAASLWGTGTDQTCVPGTGCPSPAPIHSLFSLHSDRAASRLWWGLCRPRLSEGSGLPRHGKTPFCELRPRRPAGFQTLVRVPHPLETSPNPSDPRFPPFEATAPGPPEAAI